MADPQRHAGRSVLVTGAASGIGRAAALRFLAEGARVAGLDLAAPDIAHPAFLPLAADATDPGALAAAVARAAAVQGGLDVAVCNAGAIAVTPLLEMTPSEWRRILAVNLDAAFLTAQAAARAMVAAGRGGVILMAASGAGRRGVPGLAHYCAAKAAVLNLTQTLALELAPHRIRAVAYAPGHVETPFWAAIADGFARLWDCTPEEAVARFRASVPWGRFGTPEEVAAALAWLSSPEADYISGTALSMNGAEFPG